MNASRNRTWLLPGAWAFLAAFNIGCMAIDWCLRDHTSDIQPMPGGIPERLESPLFWGGLAIFSIGVYMGMSRMRFRLLLTIVQAGAAFGILIFAWLYYVLTYGIDAL